jgi:3-oxoadipate enol-lactonase
MPNVNTILGPLYIDEHGTTDEPAALLWPSMFTDHHMWHNQIAALREHGWRTLALDPPGHGRSPGPSRTFTMDECAEAALQVLDALDVDRPVVFLGTSWGGFVAARVAARAPDRVRAMVLTNTSAERGNLLERTKATVLTTLMAISALDKVTVRMIVAGLLAPETQRQQPAIGADLTQRLLSWDRRGVIAAVRSVLIDRTQVLDTLPDISTPALIVSGQQDHTLPTIHSTRIVEKLPNARHVEVPKAAHLVPLEAPQEANSLILDFLQQLPQS